MAYSNTASVLRADIMTYVTEAAQADTMFIGEQVFPPYESEVQAGQFPKFKLATGELLTNDSTKRGQDGTYAEIKRAYETDNFATVDRGLEERVDDAYARYISRFFDAEVVAAMQTMRQVKIGHEIRCATALLNAGTFTTTAAAVAYTESNLATIAFHKDVLDARDRLNAKGIEPNAVVMSGQVMNRVRRSTLAQNYIRGAGKATDATLLLGAKDLAASFEDAGINQVLIGRLQYNNAKKGQAYVGTPVWANSSIWVGRLADGDFFNGGAGRTIVWNKEGGLWVAETYRDEKRRSDMVRVRQNTAEKVIDPTSGELITTSYS